MATLTNPNTVVGHNISLINPASLNPNADNLLTSAKNTRSIASVLRSPTTSSLDDSPNTSNTLESESVSDVPIFQHGNSLQDHTYAFTILDDTTPEIFGYSLPCNYTAALKSPFADKWQQAIQTEFNNHFANDTWTIIERNSTKPIKTIPSKWCFTFKYAQNGEAIPRARLVARRDLDSTDYTISKVYAPVASLDTIRLLLSIAVEHNLDLWSFDITTAFLYGHLLRDDLYLRIPQGLNLDPNKYACHLNKAIYGLRIASHCWEDRFSEDLLQLGLTQSIADRCMYYRVEKNSITILVTYVDDGLLATNDHKYLQHVFTQLHERYKMKTVHNPVNFIGLQLDRSPDGNHLGIHQSGYITRIGKTFNFDTDKPIRTPMEHRLHLRSIQMALKTHSFVKSLVHYYTSPAIPDQMFTVQ